MNKRGQTVGTAGTASPTVTPGKKKVLLIGGIALVIVLIIILFFIGRQFIGKAIAFTPPEGFVAGAEVPLEVPLKAGEIATIRVGAVVPENQESVAWEFSLNYDASKFKLVDVDSKLLDDWGSELLKVTKDATAGTLQVEHGTLDYTKALTGGTGGTAYRLAEVNFEALEDIDESELNSLTFTDVSVWSLSETPVDLISGALSQPSGVAKCVASDGLCGNFCTSNANDGYCGAFCTANQDTYCTAKVGSGYTTDINGDTLIDDQDAFVVLKIKQAKNMETCGDGAQSQEPCAFGKTYTCDDGSFRVDGYKGYTFNAADQCPYSDTGNYIGGS